MARAAGIDLPETRLFRVGRDRAYFGVRRFDRPPRNRRFHVHTFGNLLHANFRIPSTDYADLMEVTVALTRNRSDLLRAFRRMAFNIAAHVRDDHAKNFAFVMDGAGEWSLSPAYDLSFAAGPGGEHTMPVLGEGRAPTREHVLQLATQFDIKRSESAAVIEQVNDAIAKLPHFASEARCTKKTAKAISSQLRPV